MLGIVDIQTPAILEDIRFVDDRQTPMPTLARRCVCECPVFTSLRKEAETGAVKMKAVATCSRRVFGLGTTRDTRQVDHLACRERPMIVVQRDDLDGVFYVFLVC
jgi:hypothetical protein